MKKISINKILTEYIINNASNLAESINDIDDNDFELAFLGSIIRKKENELKEKLKNKIEFEKLKLSLDNQFNIWDATVYFSAKKYNQTYGNHSESGVTIDIIAENIIKYLTNSSENINN